jgi:ABC-type transport system involved in multi-copper enzyme maturation permease subunit
MSVLPIVDRELRVAARRWSTYLVRAGVGSLALLISIPALFFGWLSGGSSSAGQGAFTTLAYYSFVVCVLAGVWITADTLSGEKREGTLGLLFLTDLKGYDVVLGKFAAHGLHAMYALVAVFPALALPLLTGGVTAGEFWRVALALMNLLFFSLCVGTMVSAHGRDAARTFSGTVLLLLLMVAGLPLAAWLLPEAGLPASLKALGWLSPWTPFAIGQQAALGGGAGDFWASLGVSHGIAWMLLVIASIRLPRAWQEQEVAATGRSRWDRLAGGRIARLFRVRRSVARLEQDPVVWLMGDRPVLRVLLWVLAGAWAVFVIGSMTFTSNAEGLAFMVVMGGWGYLFLFKLAMVEHACRFWVEARQAGTLETLLSVPLESRRIIASHWASLRNHFLWPVLAVIVFSTLPAWWSIGRALIEPGKSKSGLLGFAMGSGMSGLFLAWGLADFVAIGWTGMWLALKLKRPQFASGLTLLCVILLPYMICYFGFGVTLVFIILPMSLITTNLRGMILQHYAPMFRQTR